MSSKNTLLLIVLINIPIFFIGYFSLHLTKRLVLRDRRAKLTAFGNILNQRMPAGEYNAILQAKNANTATRSEKIAAINEVLSPIADEIASALPGMGAGYYSKELDAIVAYAPSHLYNETVGSAIAPDHPGRQVMATDTTLVREGKMVRGEIMNAMVPISRDGNVLGYIWANELLTDINAQIASANHSIVALSGMTSFISVSLILLMLYKRSAAQKKLLAALEKTRLYSNPLPEIAGEYHELCAIFNQIIDDNEKKISAANINNKQTLQMLNSVSILLVATNVEDYRIVYVNDLLQRRLSNHGMVVGQLCYRVLHNRDTVCENCWIPTLYNAAAKPVIGAQTAWEIRQVETLNCDFHGQGQIIRWHDGRVACLTTLVDLTAAANVPIMQNPPTTKPA